MTQPPEDSCYGLISPVAMRARRVCSLWLRQRLKRSPYALTPEKKIGKVWSRETSIWEVDEVVQGAGLVRAGILPPGCCGERLDVQVQHRTSIWLQNKRVENRSWSPKPDQDRASGRGRKGGFSGPQARRPLGSRRWPLDTRKGTRAQPRLPFQRTGLRPQSQLE